MRIPVRTDGAYAESGPVVEIATRMPSHCTFEGAMRVLILCLFGFASVVVSARLGSPMCSESSRQGLAEWTLPKNVEGRGR